MRIPLTIASFFLLACSAAEPLPHTAWNDAPRPLIIGHRGSGNVSAPENTFAAFDAAAAAQTAIETDIQRTADGALVLIHDDSVDRTTGVTLGNVSSLTLAQIATLDAAQVYRPDIFSPQRVPLFDEYLQRYGAESLLAPEIKPSTGPAGTDAARLIRKHALQARVLGYSFDAQQLIAMRRVDAAIPLVLIDTAAVNPATAVSLRLWGVSIGRNALTQQYVADMHAVRTNVLTWTVSTLTEAERLVAWGVDGVVTDDPEYLAKLLNKRTPPGTTTVPIPSKLLGSGWLSHATVSGWTKAIADGFATFAGVGTISDEAYSHIQVSGIRTADSPATQKISTTIRVQNGPTSGDASRYVGLRFAWTTDNDMGLLGATGTNGYYVALRLSGAVELVRAKDGAFEIIARGTWPALVQGQVIPLRVDLDAANVTVVRTDTGDAVSATDTAHPRGGFLSVFGVGVVPAIGETSVTY
ncbi:glycerophosphodiester phosphodiesterase family protein [Anaeromyxobacter sp. SG17]|uniref:glycerophosphodiester phosphodiesterase n=1 Tax=Anaeromyxobacter sp. SG17 TaxID=2925405 RepID=UPI001F582680|nr:glycerophosphodiester phosphodiesterase family protein [Anaeromyxobacter sp. SG17]